jgi:hypothetical protein
MSKPLRVYTCTPAPFRGDHTFFARDSGLTCRGLQSLGVESRAIALRPAQPDDEPDLLRASMAELESAAWWAGHHLDGVVLYAWGAGRYRKIAQAIRASGAKLYVHMDTGGLISPVVEWRHFLAGLSRAAQGEYGPTVGWCRFVGSTLLAHSVGILWGDLRRVHHLRQADVVGAVSPIARQRLKQYCRIWGGQALENRVQLCPAPVAPYLDYRGELKERQVIAVGRWGPSDAVKRPELLMQTLAFVLAADPQVRAVIIGRDSERLGAQMREWDVGWSERVTLTGVLRNAAVRNYYCQSRVSLCTSRSESAHIASAEAVCCGCSIVGPRSPFLPSLPYYVSRQSGTLADNETPEAISHAVLQELALWDAGRRDPVAISRAWCAELHADKVARRILELMGLAPTVA